MIRRLIGILAALELPLIVAIGPLLLFPTPRRAAALIILPAVWACSWVTTRRPVPLTPVNASLWALLVLATASLMVTPNAHSSLAKFSGVALGISLYWAMVRWMGSPRRAVWGAALFIGSAGVLSILGLLGTQWRTDKFPVVAPLIDALPGLIRGIPGAVDGFNPNAVAGCLVLFLPLQASLLASRGRDRPLWVTSVQLVLLLMTTGTLVLLQSRGAWLGLGLGVLLYLLISKPARYLPVLAGVTAFAVLFVSEIGPDRLPTPKPDDSDTIAERVELWSRGIYMVRDHPFSGVGLNQFRTVVPTLYPAFSRTPDADVVHAHNQFLHTAAELGLPGLVAYLALWLGSTFVLARARRLAHSGFDRAVLSGTLVGLLAHLGFGMADAIPVGAKIGITYWFTLALGMAVASRVLTEHTLASLTGRRGT